jgi:hypothetical protein
MKRILMICLLVGLSFVFLTGNPTATAYASSCSGQCNVCACVYGGDISCPGNYTVPAPNCTCPSGIPAGCVSGSGGYYTEVLNEWGSCYTPANGPNCSACPLPPSQWWVNQPCPGD